MLIWFILFFIILAISLVLAVQSMADYETRPKHFNTLYSLFLISKENNLSNELIDKLHQDIQEKGYILSLERLFKGGKRALVIYGPSVLIKPLGEKLGLLELEDYSQKINEVGKGILVWEVGRKQVGQENLVTDNLFPVMPEMSDKEEFWWQLVLQPVKGSGEAKFQAIVRALIKAEDPKRASWLQNELLAIGKTRGLAMLPQAYSAAQMVKLYQERSLPIGGDSFPMNIVSKTPKGVVLTLKSGEIRSLLDIKG